MTFAGRIRSIRLWFLLYWSCVSIVAIRRHLPNVRVGVVLDGCKHGKTSTAGRDGVASDFVNRTANFTKIAIEPVTIKLDNCSVEHILRTFCSEILQQNVTVVVLQTKEKKLTQFISNLASQSKIPIIGSITQDPLLFDKEYYSTFVRNVASDVQQFRVFVDVINYVGRRQGYVIVSDETSYGLAFRYYNDVEFTSVKIISLSDTDIQNRAVSEQLLKLKSSTARAILLHCDTKLASIILWFAKDLGLINDDIMWILSERTLQSVEHLHTLPSRIYSFRAETSSNQEKFEQTKLIDSLSLIQRTFDSMDDDEVRGYGRSSSNCYDSSSIWTKGVDLYKLLLENTQSRNMANYQHCSSFEILYLQHSHVDETNWIPVGVWSEAGLTFKTRNLLHFEKNSMEEIPRLRAAVVEYPPLTMKVDYDEDEGCFEGLECAKYIGDTNMFTRHCCYGLAIDVLKFVKTELQFEPFVYFVRDGNYGAKNSSVNMWNGVVRDILEGQADIAIDLMSNQARLEVIDFSLRWTHAGLALLVLVGEKELEKFDFSFFQPFTTHLWISIIGVVNMYIVVLWVTDRLSPYGHRKSAHAERRNGFDMSESMWYCWGICFDNQFVDSRPRSFSARASAVFLAVFALMCVTSYTANLTAHLLSDDTKPEVTGIRDPKITAPQSTITYGVVKSSYVDSFFELNEDPVMQSMFRTMRDKKNLVDNFTHGVERVKNGDLDIFISEVLSIDYEVAKQKSNTYPKLQVVGATKPFAESGYSYAFKKNSPWKPKFDLVINRMKATNKPSELYKKWVSSGEDRSEEYHQRLDVHSLSGVFFLGACLAMVALVFLYIENRFYTEGFIYNDMRSDNTPRHGERKYSAQVKLGLLDANKEKDEPEYPDITDYLHHRRKRNLIIQTLYNPKLATKKHGEMEEQIAAASVV